MTESDDAMVANDRTQHNDMNLKHLLDEETGRRIHD
jgi:hypothetical protein